MTRSRHSSVLIVAALLGMLAQLGLPRSWGFVPPKTLPLTADSSTAAGTYKVWSAVGSREDGVAAAQQNSRMQGFTSVGRVCATAALMFVLILGVMAPPSHAKTAEQLVREALGKTAGAGEQEKFKQRTEAQQAQIEKYLRKSTEQQKAIAIVTKAAAAGNQDTASVLEDAANKQRERAEKLLTQEKQTEKAAANLQKLEEKKSAERLLRDAGEKAQADEIKKSTESKEQQAAELQQLVAKQAQQKEQDEKQEALRVKILKDLEKRKADAEKAAAEAEAIADKIEMLAKDARKAALAAKEFATVVK